jgi:hypothetical protein
METEYLDRDFCAQGDQYHQRSKEHMPTCILDELLPLLSMLNIDDQMLRGIQI